ncbi:MAG: Xaa-Pro aminopeptidase [Planctomycetota bacterium]|jgi:Xaa-Pro aminopeptidase
MLYRCMPRALPVLLLISAPVLAQNTVPDLSGTPLGGGNLARAADGEAVCGLGKAFHAGRRAALAKSLGKGVLVLRGLPDPRDYKSFSQDKNFWYLTGVESPNVAFVMNLETGKEVLLVSRPSAFAEQWRGEIWDTDDAWVTNITGIEDLRTSRELLDTIEELRTDDGPIWTIGAPWVTLTSAYDSAVPYVKKRKRDKLDGRASREDALAAKLGEHFEVEVQDATDALYDLRLVKTPEEVAAMARAGRAGGLALAEAMRSTRPDLGEWELDALMTWVQQRHGADGAAYAAIVGSGVNALILHYNTSNRRMRAGEVVLADFGPEVDHYVTDITRTWPVTGTFSKRQAELYQAVLDAQTAGIAVAMPGATLSEVDQACAAVLKERGFEKLMAHSAVHWIGMEVHDPGVRNRPFVEGMAFTVEPGLYETSTGIGIRIEDVVVITKDGHRVITDACPKQLDEVQRLVKEQGVLDLLDGESE